MSKKESLKDVGKSKNITYEKFSAKLKTKPLNPKQDNQDNSKKDSNVIHGGENK